MVGGGPFRLQPGEWTDDTSMALCLAASLVEQDAFDPLDQIQRYCRWYQKGYMSSTSGCFDIGNTVRCALDQFSLCGEPESGSTNPSSAGNGSIMRLAPVPMYFGGNATAAIEYSGKSSLTTHGATSCVDACRYFGGLLWAALKGVSKDELLSAGFSPSHGSWSDAPLCDAIAEVANGSFKRKAPPEIRGTGYVVESLEAALWAFHSTHDFRSGCLLAVNLGNDADTTGAIFGQLAGAHYGYEAIPIKWRTMLKHGDLITDFAKRLFTANSGA